jgi:putative ABC transport system permease protein
VLTDPVDRHPYATTPAPLAEALSDGYTNISLVTQLVKGFGGDAFYQQNYAEMKGYFTDSAFFEIFDFELAKGDPGSAMALPNSMVITAEVARKLFKDEDPMGKVVNFSDRGIGFYTEEGNAPVDWGDYKITGVLRDVDYKTHLKFDVLVSINSLPLLYQQNKFHDASQSWNDYSRA